MFKSLFPILFIAAAIFFLGAGTAKAVVFTVTKTADTNDGVCNADCSLREAINAASLVTNDAADIYFRPSVFSSPQVITLTEGVLQITNPHVINIYGPGANLLTIDGNHKSGVFRISNYSTNVFDDWVQIFRLTIVNGNAFDGGGIYNDHNILNLSNVIVKNNSAQNSGGGIYNVNGYDLTISNSTIENNQAQSGGGTFNGSNGYLIINNSVIRNNFADFSGGGLFNNPGGVVSINTSTFTGNTASKGGGLYCGIGRITLSKTTVSNNQANEGGGIYNKCGSVNNNENFNVSNSIINNNTAHNKGGGIYNQQFGIVKIANSTISRNLSIEGGGIYNIYNAELISSTVAENSAMIGGGVFTNIVNNNEAKAINSIFADNTADTNPDFSGTLNSQGFNLLENIQGLTLTGETATNILEQDPQLLPLRNYGGTTETYALKLASPAIDKGNGLVTDQRLRPRPSDNLTIPNSPKGNGSDIGAFERQLIEPALTESFDFDGDSRTDISIFRPAQGEWWYLRSFDGSNRAFQFGSANDKIVPADFTGDAKTDIAFWRESTGEWFVLKSEDSTFSSFPFGTSGDKPVSGDFDGDGIADPVVFRPFNSTWYTRKSSGGITIIQFGVPEDIPMVEDFDGDGKDDIAVFRPTLGEWWIRRSSDENVIAFQFGQSGDKPVPADYTGDGKTDVAVWRPSNSNWYILRSENNSLLSFAFGTSGDIPSPGDYDGDGRTDAGIFRPENGTWYLQQSTNGLQLVQFGFSGDIPLPSAYIR